MGHSGAHTMVNRKKEKSKDTKKESSLFACNVDVAERNVNMETKRGLELELIDTQRRNEACEGGKRGGRGGGGGIVVQGNTRKLILLSVEIDRLRLRQ